LNFASVLFEECAVSMILRVAAKQRESAKTRTTAAACFPTSDKVRTVTAKQEQDILFEYTHRYTATWQALLQGAPLLLSLPPQELSRAAALDAQISGRSR